jgi:hypothetical protein
VCVETFDSEVGCQVLLRLDNVTILASKRQLFEMPEIAVNEK